MLDTNISVMSYNISKDTYVLDIAKPYQSSDELSSDV